MNLLINACVRKGSRTLRIARALMEKLDGPYEEVYLSGEDIHPLDDETLGKRDLLIDEADFSDPMFRYAKQLAEADKVVIAAPYWDLSFPSILKVYIENVYVMGITARMSPDGIPIGMCRAETLYYVTTAGGLYSEDFGYLYVRAVLCGCFGVKESRLIKAEMLDTDGADPERTVNETIDSIMADETVC